MRDVRGSNPRISRTGQRLFITFVSLLSISVSLFQLYWQFTTPKMKIGLEPYTWMFPESSATNTTNTNFTRTNNTQSLAHANRALISFQRQRCDHHVSQVLCVYVKWKWLVHSASKHYSKIYMLKRKTSYNPFKEMFTQCRFKSAFCCAVLNVPREIVPVSYCS